MGVQDGNVSKRFKVGLFAMLGLLLIGTITVYVNDKPFWWRACQLVHINVEDATGLKSKSPVRSLGLQIGYLRSVELHQDHVRLGICITAPVEVLKTTRAYIRGEGFLGDKFVELKPVRYVGDRQGESKRASAKEQSPGDQSSLRHVIPFPVRAMAWLYSAPAMAQQQSEREIPVGSQTQDVQDLVNQVDTLVNEMTDLTNNLKQTFDPKELDKTIKQLNETLSNASRTLSPEGNLTTTAQRTLAKLEDAIEQLRDMMTRVNQGQGSVGMILNDPTYAEELKAAVKNLNDLLGKVDRMRLIVDMGASQIEGIDGGRGWFKLEIWPDLDRYYLVGLTSDPRGEVTAYTTTTTVGNQTVTVPVTQVEETGLLLTGMLGKVFWNRLDLSLGFLYGDGTLSTKLNLWKSGEENRIQLIADTYARTQSVNEQNEVNARFLLRVRPYSSLYLHGGLESVRRVGGQLPYSFGAGIAFDDKDIKVLFSFL